MEDQITIFDMEYNSPIKTKVVNVASVPQRSPFRYPGGKTWLIPTVRKWLKQDKKIDQLIEPFAGGAIVSLTAAFENLADKILIIEIDEEVAAVWETIINGENEWLADKILSFNLTQDNVKKEFIKPNKDIKDIAFCTILKNRIFHGGIIAKGSGLIKNGENGKGIASRWYPKTLSSRIRAISLVKNKIEFRQDDGFKIIEKSTNNNNAYFFIDPPYTIAGKRLYNYYNIDHEKLINLTSRLKAKYILTYDFTEEIRALANKYNLQYRTIPMNPTQHYEKHENIIYDNTEGWYNKSFTL